MPSLLKNIVRACLSVTLLWSSGDGAWAALVVDGPASRCLPPRAVCVSASHYCFTEQAIVQRLASQILPELRLHRPTTGRLWIRFNPRPVILPTLGLFGGGIAYLWNLAQQVALTSVTAAAAPWREVLLPEFRIIDQTHRTLWSLFGQDAMRIADLNKVVPKQLHLGQAIQTGKEIAHKISAPDLPGMPRHFLEYRHPVIHHLFNYLQDPVVWLVVAAAAASGWIAWLLFKRWQERRAVPVSDSEHMRREGRRDAWEMTIQNITGELQSIGNRLLTLGGAVSAVLLFSWLPALAQQGGDLTPQMLADQAAKREFQLFMQRNATRDAVKTRDDYDGAFGLDFGFAGVFEANPTARGVGFTVSGTIPLYDDPTAAYNSKASAIAKLRRTQEARLAVLSKRQRIADAVISYYGAKKRADWLGQVLDAAEMSARQTAEEGKANLVAALDGEARDVRASLAGDLAAARQRAQKALNALRAEALPPAESKVGATAESISPPALQALLKLDADPSPEAVLAALSAAGSVEHIQGVYGLSTRTWPEKKFPRKLTLSAGFNMQHIDHLFNGLWSLVGVQPVWEKYEKHDWDNALREADKTGTMMSQARDNVVGAVIAASRARRENLDLAAKAYAVAREAMGSAALGQTAADRGAEAADYETEAARQALILISWGLSADDSEAAIADKIQEHFARAVQLTTIPARIQVLKDFMKLHAHGRHAKSAENLAKVLDGIVAWSQSDVKIPKAPEDPEPALVAVVFDLINAYATNNTTSSAPYAPTIESRPPGSPTPLVTTGQVAGHVTISPNAGKQKDRKDALKKAQGIASGKKDTAAKQNGFWQAVIAGQSDLVYLQALQDSLRIAEGRLDGDWAATPEGRAARADLAYQQAKVAIDLRAKAAQAQAPANPNRPKAQRESFEADLEAARLEDALSDKALRSITFNGWGQASQHLYYGAVSPNIKDLLQPVITYMFVPNKPPTTFAVQRILLVAADHMRALQSALKTVPEIEKLDAAWVQTAEAQLAEIRKLPADDQTPLRLMAAEQGLAAARHAERTDKLNRSRLEQVRDDWNTWSLAQMNHPLALLWKASASPAAEPVQVQLAKLELERIKAGRPAITAGADVVGGPFVAGTGSYVALNPTNFWGGQGGVTIAWDQRHKELEKYGASRKAAEEAVNDAQKSAADQTISSELKALAGFEEALVGMETSLGGTAPPQAAGLLQVALAQTRKLKLEKADAAGVAPSAIQSLSPASAVAVGRFGNPEAVAAVLSRPSAPAAPFSRTFSRPVHGVSLSGFLTKFKNKGAQVVGPLYHWVLKKGQQAAVAQAETEEGNLAKLENEQNRLQYAVWVNNINDLVVADERSLEASAAAVASSQNQWAQLVGDAKAGLRNLDDPQWEVVMRRWIQAWMAYSTARENLDRDQATLAAMSADAHAGLDAIVKAAKPGETLSAKAEDLALITTSVNAPAPMAAAVARDAAQVMELNAVKKLAARVAGTTADSWVLTQLLAVARNEGKELGAARLDALADIAETVGLADLAGNSRRAKVAAFRENLDYAIAFLRENFYFGELNGPRLDGPTVLRRLAEGDFELKKRFKDVMTQTRGLQGHGRQWVAAGWVTSMREWNLWAGNRAGQFSWARPIVEAMADLIQTPEALAAVKDLQFLAPDLAFFPFLQQLGEIHLSGSQEHRGGYYAVPGFKHDVKDILARLEKARSTKNLDWLAEPSATLSPGAVAADAAEQALQTITVSAPTGDLWTTGHLVDYLRRTSPPLAVYLDGPLFTPHGAVDIFWQAVFGGEKGDPRRLSDRRKTVYFNEQIDLRPLWEKVRSGIPAQRISGKSRRRAAIKARRLRAAA